MPLLEEKGEPEIVPLWASRRRSDLDQVDHGQPYGGPPYACYLSAYLFGLRYTVTLLYSRPTVQPFSILSRLPYYSYYDAVARGGVDVR